MTSVHFADNNYGWTAGDSGTILKTTNGGTNWTRQVSGTNNSLRSVYFPDNNTGWVVGPYGIILKTTNGGTQWISQSIGQDYHLTSVYFNDNNTGWVVGGFAADNILKTTNGGTNWISQISGYNYLNSIYFADNNTGWIAGVLGTILKTTNNVTGRIDGSYNLSGDYGTIKYNSQGVMQWIERYDGPVNSYDEAVSIAIDGSGNVYVTGKSIGNETGYDYATIKYSQSTGISQISSGIPENFTLLQNYPNPFNPVTNLEFGISDLGFVSLKVYDILGKEVATLVNEKLSPGKYKVEFDGSGLTSGVYFYRITAGEFTDTKRMLFVK